LSFTVFYSWQSDLPRKITRDFIHEAAVAAVARMGIGLVLEESPRLDHSTDGVSGLPSIGDTILGKIDQCGMFIADVSFVGRTNRGDRQKKLMPNPNVLFELGYAFARIGWRRLILTMNTAYGEEKDLPFDLRFRRFPFGYKISEDRHDIDQQRDKLSRDIEMALRSMHQEEHQVVTDVLKKLDGHARHVISQYSRENHFWEVEIGKNKIPGTYSVSINRLLQLGIIECVPFTNDLGYAYKWTYMGTLCIRRLNYPEPLPVSMPSIEIHTPSVLISDCYDQILRSGDKTLSNIGAVKIENDVSRIKKSNE
jgi:hypothetical protein